MRNLIYFLLPIICFVLLPITFNSCGDSVESQIEYLEEQASYYEELADRHEAKFIALNEESRREKDLREYGRADELKTAAMHHYIRWHRCEREAEDYRLRANRLKSK